jgi:hypothetical protein
MCRVSCVVPFGVFLGFFDAASRGGIVALGTVVGLRIKGDSDLVLDAGLSWSHAAEAR